MTTPQNPVAPRTGRRLPVWTARTAARLLRQSGVLTSVLLGVVSLLIALFAYLSSQAADTSADFDSLANRISVDSTAETQKDYAQHLTDTQIWLQIVASGQTVDESPLGRLLSQRWLDAVERYNEIPGNDASSGLPTDDRYFQELTIKSEAYADNVKRAYTSARDAGATSSRLTGATVIFSAALLLLTVASGTRRDGPKLALNGAALAIMVIAVVIGFSPIGFG
jgi:hypothetical protein